MKKYTILITGYGSEITIGSVTDEQKEILSNEEKDLIDIVNDDLEEFGGYYEIDDQFHRWGAADVFTITIKDENGDTLYEINDNDKSEYDTDDFELFENKCPEINEELDLLITVSTEKGVFFKGEIEIDDDFDITKLKITVDSDIEVGEYYFGDIISGVYYNGEEIDNYGGDTNGKSFDVYKNF
jgi:hypothetical protein